MAMPARPGALGLAPGPPGSYRDAGPYGGLVDINVDPPLVRPLPTPPPPPPTSTPC